MSQNRAIADKPEDSNIEFASERSSIQNKNEDDINNHLEDGVISSQEGDVAYTLKDLKRLTLRCDLIIISMIGVCYIFFYIVQTTLSYAAIFGIKKDLHLEGDQYSWLSSIFYFGFIAWCFPNNYLLLKFPVSYLLGLNIFLWGMFLCFQAACSSYGGLLACRFLGGAVESIADPSYLLITSMWYTRREQPLRIGIWYTFNGIGVAFAGLLGYAIGHIKGALPSWKYEFIVIGTLCMAWGIFIFFAMPKNPMQNRYFNDREKKILAHKLRGNQTGIETKIFKWYQVKEAFLDPKMYLLFLMCFFGNIPNGVTSNFGTMIVNALGFDTLGTTLLQIPYGAYIALCIISAVLINDKLHTKLKKNFRCIIAIFYLFGNVAGSACLYAVDQKHHAGKLIAYYLTGTYNASFVLIMSLSTSNISGYTKKIIFNAFIFLGYCVGNIAGPFFAKSDQAANSYPLASGAMLFSNAAEILCLVIFFFYAKWQNEKRDKEQGIAPGQEASNIEDNFEDLTDYENRNFRYIY
ncbi:Thi73 protein [Saccharomycopsis crataegensis]|uniref:Thi73 protein n=1 Tax=Saccharomycopsis crataegensis TaxID=43959 RepID=A0AAV5QNZ7_9ASCO|nr:Thi73 protein [Saccharomycopsis crataegensis]